MKQVLKYGNEGCFPLFEAAIDTVQECDATMLNRSYVGA